MDESKQNRKTPLTTVSLSQEMASRLDALLKEKYPGMKRKEFLEGAIAYFERTGYDLQSDMMDFSSLERLTDRLEASAKVIDEENKGREELKQLFLDIQQKQLALPSADQIIAATDAKAAAEAELNTCKKEIELKTVALCRAESKNDDLLQEIAALKAQKDDEQAKYWENIEWHKAQLKDQKDETATLRNKLAVAIRELERCSSGIFTKPSKTPIESLNS